MRLHLLLLSVVAIASLPAQDLPKGIRISTWVREDIFAGFLEHDMTRFSQGVAKLDRVLAANPNAADALTWKGGAELYLAVRRYEAGDMPGFNAGYSKAKEHFADAAGIAKQVPAYAQAIHAIAGGSYTVFADRMPPAHQREAWQRVRAHYTSLRDLQQPGFDKFPIHFRGEVMAGLAQAAQRLGEVDSAKALTAELVASFPGTPYAVFAKRWLDKPETMAKSKLACVTCHDPGRLQAVLSSAPGN